MRRRKSSKEEVREEDGEGKSRVLSYVTSPQRGCASPDPQHL